VVAPTFAKIRIAESKVDKPFLRINFPSSSEKKLFI
jgi:hypothetical protein